ncbi:hypothetical protein DEO72_LG10g1349 [Vigna unguiculata]|uniref:Uncharacterized protein n=1 Tax=Vigna unguiculata TaxID=3917 RepID=A0A4D6N8F8_VIGUN|nr:hypothetical protein DEO72_LG10g1349 [Vigna unguiculata]
MVDDGRSVVPIRGSSCGGAHSVLVLSLVIRWCGGHSVVVVQSSPATMVAIQSSSATLERAKRDPYLNKVGLNFPLKVSFIVVQT